MSITHYLYLILSILDISILDIPVYSGYERYFVRISKNTTLFGIYIK